MPRVNLYLNEADNKRWEKLDNKSRFVSDALNGLSSNGRTVAFEAADSGSSPDEPATTMVVMNKETYKNLTKTGSGKLNLCGHGAGAQFCKFARSGKPCTYKAAK